MTEPKAKRPATLKGLLALLGAGALYLVSQLLGIDLTEAKTKPEQGAPRVEVPAPSEPADLEPAAPGATETRRDDTDLIRQLFRANASDRIVEAEGEIVHILPLDNEGSRHQNFLLELANSVTLKISHNIDLAPQLPIQKGDRLRFHGEYEWNEKGGVVHWTHRDPQGRHEHGWLEHKGQRYE